MLRDPAVVDAKHILQHLEEEKPEGVENESVEQVAFADKILLNKADLLPTAEERAAVVSRIRSINAFAPVIETEFSAAPIDQARAHRCSLCLGGEQRRAGRAGCCCRWLAGCLLRSPSSCL